MMLGTTNIKHKWMHLPVLCVIVGASVKEWRERGLPQICRNLRRWYTDAQPLFH